MLDFKLCIDTGDAKAVCCRQSVYGIHEGKFMTDHIFQLEITTGYAIALDHGDLFY